MSLWCRPTRQFHRLPSDSFPDTLTCQPMAAGRDGDTARAAVDPSVSPSTADNHGNLRPGGSRSRTSPVGVGGRGGRGSRRSHHSLRAEGSTAVRPDGVLAKDRASASRLGYLRGLDQAGPKSTLVDGVSRRHRHRMAEPSRAGLRPADAPGQRVGAAGLPVRPISGARARGQATRAW